MTELKDLNILSIKCGKLDTNRASLVAQMVKNLPEMQKTEVRSLDQEDPQRREWIPTPLFLSGESHGKRGVVGYSPWYRKESNTTE